MNTSIYVDEICKTLKINLQPNERRALIEHLEKKLKELAATKLELPKSPSNIAGYAQGETLIKKGPEKGPEKIY